VGGFEPTITLWIESVPSARLLVADLWRRLLS